MPQEIEGEEKLPCTQQMDVIHELLRHVAIGWELMDQI